MVLVCSNENAPSSPNTSSDSILPTKISFIDGRSSTINYNGDKIVSIIDDTEPFMRTVFTYEGENILNITRCAF